MAGARPRKFDTANVASRLRHVVRRGKSPLIPAGTRLLERQALTGDNSALPERWAFGLAPRPATGMKRYDFQQLGPFHAREWRGGGLLD
jgi:hypothetical protein